MIISNKLCGVILLSLFSFSPHAEQGLQNSPLDVVRSKYKYLSDAQFITKTLMFKNNYAYFCGTASSSEGIPVERDGLLEVFDIIMANNNGQWTEVANLNSLAKHGDEACHLRNADDIDNIIKGKNNTEISCSDLNKKNPERQAILDSLRVDPEEKFIVKRICLTPKAAYFCGAKTDKDGFVMKTGNAIDVYDFILEKGKDNRWHKKDNLGSFAQSINSINCYFGSNSVFLYESTLVNFFLKNTRDK